MFLAGGLQGLPDDRVDGPVAEISLDVAGAPACLLPTDQAIVDRLYYALCCLRAPYLIRLVLKVAGFSSHAHNLLLYILLLTPHYPIKILK